MIMIKKNRVIILFCGLGILISACFRMFLLFSGKIIGADFYIELIQLFFSAVCVIGFFMRNQFTGLKIFSIGILGIFSLGIIRDFPQIMAGDVLTIIKLPLILILVYCFVLCLRENIEE